MIRSAVFLFFVFLSALTVQAQISGIVTDENNEPLPYVNIYVKSTTSGTTTNFDGEYFLKLGKGNYEIIYQYVGYTPTTKNINYDGNSETVDVQLLPQKYQLKAVEINANAEDPAYAIIRKAQAKRKYYHDKMDHYECDAYVKGFNKVVDAPEKILGQEVGDMDGALDSTRQGVVYLSESVSKLYVKDGKSKEVLHSSKVSGDDQGYSFNSAQEMYFNFYDSNINLNTKRIVTPIAPSAMSYYKYVLEGTQYDDNGQLINKIKVIPKDAYSATFYGYIYIIEDLWSIHSLDLGVTAKSMQVSFIDSLVFKQLFVPVADDQWMLVSNVLRFNLGALGFKIEGNFACVYSNYELNNVDDNIFSNEIFKVEKEANERSEQYWDSLRPIPLTLEESIDYHRKDSIQIVRMSPEYLDSIDRESNKLGVMDVISGYRHQNSIKNTSWSFPGLLPSISINTIQGVNADFKMSYSKSYDDEFNKYMIIRGTANYGLSEKVLRPEFTFYYKANSHNRLNFTVKGGKSLDHYSRREPISNGLNSLFTYLLRRNYLKAYDKNYGSIAAGSHLGSIFYGSLSVTYEDRSAVTNNFDNSLFYKDSRTFTSNNPQNLSNDNIAFQDHQALILRAGLKITFGQKIWSYPNQTFRVGSEWPALSIFYKKAIPSLGGDVDYDILYANVSKSYSLGMIGTLRGYATAGKYLKSNNVEFIDYYHFMGNQTHIGKPADYYNQFLLLNYYSHSSIGEFAEVHLQHNFNGFILRKIPLLKRLEWRMAAGAKLLKSSEQDLYTEFHVGIDNVGYKLFRLLRVDLVWANQNFDILGERVSEKSKFGVVIGFLMDL